MFIIYNAVRVFQKSTTLVNVAGALYLFLVIMIGAFVFANLVVAVVVTNLVSNRIQPYITGGVAKHVLPMGIILGAS